MKVFILRSVVFEDPEYDLLVNEIAEAYTSMGDEVAVYQMPACDDLVHWAGYAIVDYSDFGDLMICVDFPTALIAHKNKRIILTKSLPDDHRFQQAVVRAIDEAMDCFKTQNVDYDCENFPAQMADYLGKRMERV